jgi:hypothetical protein
LQAIERQQCIHPTNSVDFHISRSPGPASMRCVVRCGMYILLKHKQMMVLPVAGPILANNSDKNSCQLNTVRQ